MSGNVEILSPSEDHENVKAHAAADDELRVEGRSTWVMTGLAAG